VLPLRARAGDGDGLGGHTLVISDHGDAFRANAQVRFTPVGATLTEDSLDRWSAHRPLGGIGDHAASRDCRSLSARAETASSHVEAGVTPDAPAWHGASSRERPTAADCPRPIDALPAHYDGEGTLRSAAPGLRFVLVDHPEHPLDAPEGREFLVTAVHHQARNDLTERFSELLVALGPMEPDESAEAPLAKPAELYRNRLVAQRPLLPWRPLALDAAGRPLYPRPDAVRPLTAVVVVCGEPTHADRSLRIRVQFSRQHGSEPAGGRGHSVGADEASAGAWLRVITPMAGGGGRGC
jgi:type VI secretion system secreted protein VgrG